MQQLVEVLNDPRDQLIKDLTLKLAELTEKKKEPVPKQNLPWWKKKLEDLTPRHKRFSIVLSVLFIISYFHFRRRDLGLRSQLAIDH